MKIKHAELKKHIKNLRAHIFMKCLECTNCQPKEILHCQSYGCPLWEERPIEAKGLYTLIKRLRQKNNDVHVARK